MAMVALVLWALLLLLAPPASNYVWGINGFRSLSLTTHLLLVVAAALATLPALFRWRSPMAWAACAGAIVLVVAFVWPERIHLLGDTQLRLRAMAAFSQRMVPATLAQWAGRLHAQPLDVLANVFVPIGLYRSGLPLDLAVSWVGAALGAVAFAGVWRVAGRLGAPPAARVALALALSLNGMLEAFAGYAESGGLLVAALWWWWAEMLAPLERPRQALWIVIAWIVAVMSHRVALVLWLPILWRALGPAFPNDQPAARRALLAASVALAVIAGVSLFATGAGRQLVQDTRELLYTARLTDLLRVAPTDVLNAIALVAPLAFLAPFLAGRASRAAWRRPELRLVVVTAVPLVLALMWLFPVGGSGLGAHRDWDANLLLGVTLCVGAGLVLATLPPPRLRGALAAVLPLLALGALSWVAVNADERAALARAEALLSRPPRLLDAQRSHLHLWFGQLSMDHRQFAAAGDHYDQAFALNPNPRRALLAAEAWAMAGDFAAARRSLGRARATPGLSPELLQGADRIEGLIDAMAADSTGAAPAGPNPSGQ
jgi:hypothetical protein